MKTTIEQQWNGAPVKIQGQKVVGRTAFELGLVVEGQAKLLCPVDYGYLAASITTQSATEGTELETPTPNRELNEFYKHDVSSFKKIDKPQDPNEVLVGSAVDYAAYVEFGTKKSDAQPFLRPALDLAKGRMLTLFYNNGKYYFGDYLRRPEEVK